jgi:hypothetical protein
MARRRVAPPLLLSGALLLLVSLYLPWRELTLLDGPRWEIERPSTDGRRGSAMRRRSPLWRSRRPRWSR